MSQLLIALVGPFIFAKYDDYLDWVSRGMSR